MAEEEGDHRGPRGEGGLDRLVVGGVTGVVHGAVLVIGALAALVLAMLEADHFWIAHALFVGFYASAVLEGITKVALHRGGVSSW